MTSSKLPVFLQDLFSQTSHALDASPDKRGLCRLERVLVIKEKYEDDVTQRTVLLTFQRGDIHPADFISEMKKAVLDDIEATNDHMCHDIEMLHEHFKERLLSEHTDISSPHLKVDTDVTTVYQLILENGVAHRLFAKKGNMLHVPEPYVERVIDTALQSLNLPRGPEKRLG